MKPFHFKKFSISHHNSTMKVGTDAILLSAWCNIDKAKTILDVGTGCGIIALLLSTRCNSQIDAIELDEKSVKEAGLNFRNSIFSDRLTIIEDDFINYSENSKRKYDLIISNPPFFTNNLESTNQSRKAARHVVNLNARNLCIGASKLLSALGRLVVVLPYDKAPEFIDQANLIGLSVHRKQIILPKKNAIANRINLEFGNTVPEKIIESEIIIRDNDNSHSTQYKKFVGDYLISI